MIYQLFGWFVFEFCGKSIIIGLFDQKKLSLSLILNQIKINV